MQRIVFVPNVEKGMGGGHLFRAFQCARETGNAIVALPDNFEIPPGLTVSAPVIAYQGLAEFPASGTDDSTVFVFDCRETSESLFSLAGRKYYTLGIDEGGDFREKFNYLADITHELLDPGSGNLALSPFPENSGDVSDLIFPFRHVLLSFGSEDEADLTLTLAGTLIREKLFRADAITVIEGPLYNKYRAAPQVWPEGIDVFRNVKDISRFISRFDCVFTHFGLTAYEAAAVGVPVILFNPTDYHRLLSKKAGFLEIGVKKVNSALLSRYLSERQFFTEYRRQMITLRVKRKNDTLSRLFRNMRPEGSCDCPVCGEHKKKTITRFADRTYIRCRKCGIVRMIRFFGETSVYAEEYFFESYRNQYGKTYLDDFQQIKQQGLRRVKLLKQCMGGRSNKKGFSVLDIGCAYGPFCLAVNESDGEATGLDISAAAVSYVRDTLGIPAVVLDFENSKMPEQFLKKQFDAVAMWYVIEHFTDTRKVFERIYNVLKPGGILAFSTPNMTGISGRKDPVRFLENSPTDHFTVWSPKTARRGLEANGFRVKKVRVTGHHPERFFSERARVFRRNRLMRGLAGLISRILGLGDTFEMYAVKKSGKKS